MDTYNTYSDEQLLTLLKENEPIKSHVFKIIWERHSDTLMQFCRYSTQTCEDAQDLFQNIWVAFLDGVRKTTIRNIKFYLYKIAHNKVMQRYKECKNKQKVIDKNLESDNITSPTLLIEEIENQELISNFHLALDCLDFVQAQYLILYWVSGLSFREIADLFEVSYDSVRKQCSRGMKIVIEIIKPKYAIKESEDKL